MNLDRLQTFRVLAETLHFRKTAERLKISQSAVSQQIAALEREVGVPLFERIGRRVFLTPAGQVLAEETVKVLAALDRALEAVAVLGRGDTGRLRVGASTTPGIYLLPEVLGRFRAALPHVELEFRIANSDSIQTALLANELDVGVIGDHVAHAELFEVLLGPDRIVLVGAPQVVGRARRVKAADLPKWSFLAREAGSGTRKAVDRALAQLGVKVSPAFEMPSPEALVRGATAGLGVTFLSRHAAAGEVAAGRLVELEVEGLELTRPLAAAHHRDKRVSAAMRELMTLLQAAIQQSGGTARRASRPRS